MEPAAVGSDVAGDMVFTMVTKLEPAASSGHCNLMPSLLTISPPLAQELARERAEAKALKRCLEAANQVRGALNFWLLARGLKKEANDVTHATAASLQQGRPLARRR